MSYSYKHSVKTPKKCAWDAGKTVFVRWQKNRLHPQRKVCYLMFPECKWFKWFSSWNIWKEESIQLICTKNSNIVLKDPKYEYIVFFFSRNFLFILRSRYTINIYNSIYCKHPHLSDIFIESWLDIRLTKERPCKWWEIKNRDSEVILPES